MERTVLAVVFFCTVLGCVHPRDELLKDAASSIAPRDAEPPFSPPTTGVLDAGTSGPWDLSPVPDVPPIDSSGGDAPAADHPLLDAGEPSPPLQVFPLPRRQVRTMTPGQDGSIWFLYNITNAVGRITRDGVVTEFTIPSDSAMLGSIISTADGSAWFTEFTDGGAVWRVSPSGDFRRFPFPASDLMIPWDPCLQREPGRGLILVLRSRIDSQSGGFGRISMDGTIVPSPLPPGDGPTCLAVGADGSIWLALGTRLGRVGNEGSITYYDIDTPRPEIHNMLLAADGNVWFLDSRAARVSKVLSNGVITQYDLPSTDVQSELASDSLGNLWYLREITRPNGLGRVSSTGARFEFPLPQFASALVVDSEDNVWLALNEGLGRIRP